MDLNEIIRSHGDRLPPIGKLSREEEKLLAARLSEVDFGMLKLADCREDLSGKGRIAPIHGLRLFEIAQNREKYEREGLSAIRAGKLAAVLLAGGQGTRLGIEGPKGAFDIGLTKPLTIFELLIRNLTDVVDRAGAYVPRLIMTSEKNDEETKRFFSAHDNFGYPSSYLRFFKQEMAPSADFGGKLLLESPTMPALSPNGNGGWYTSMKKAGADKDFPRVEWYNVFGVDNVLQRIADPVFLGATMMSGSLCGAKVVAKACPEERVGVLCLEDGRPSVIEYYEMDEGLSAARDENGDLLYLYGAILNYLFSAEKLKEVSSERIPVHVVKKKIPYWDGEKRVVPEHENGYKFETLILDMVRLMGSCLPFEVEREREFAPVKNRTGADSVDTARELLKFNGVEL